MMISEATTTSIIGGLFSTNRSQQLESAAKMNEFLLKNMPGIGPLDIQTQRLIDSGVARRLVHFLGVKDSPSLHSLAAEVLSIIATTRPDLLVDHYAVPRLIKLIESRRDYVRDPALRALANVVVDPVHHYYVLKSGTLMPLLNLLYKDTTNLSTLKAATLTLCNLCRGKPPPTFEQYLCDGSQDGIQSVIDAGFVPKLVEVLRHPSPSVLIPVLRIVDTIVSKDKNQIQSVIDCGALRILSDLLNRDYDKKVKGATYLVVLIITTGFREHIQPAIEANWIPRLVSLAQNNELGMKHEAVLAISNATSSGSHDQIKYLVEQGCIKALCDLLVHPDPLIISACLNGLENILNAGEAEMNIGDVNNYSQLIEDAKGLEKIENLQHHGNKEIYEKALKILKTYWVAEDIEN